MFGLAKAAFQDFFTPYFSHKNPHGFYTRVNPNADAAAAKNAASITALVFVFEDLPQLVIDSISTSTLSVLTRPKTLLSSLLPCRCYRWC